MDFIFALAAGPPQQHLGPACESAGDGAAVEALASAGPHLLIAAHRDGRARAYGVPSRTSL
ncbi:hypothetical protein ACIGPN_03975 [Streptomyces afghaniensis]|nr:MULTISPECIES: hypothetical protein [Streptomyces]UOB14318.1 hypothetical protein MQE23_37030 [Streptomyces sp. HP-A2021]